MNDHIWQDRFHKDVVTIIEHQQPNVAEQAPEEYLEMLALAQKLTNADSSGNSLIQSTLRAGLLRQYEEFHIHRKANQVRPKQARLSGWVWSASLIAVLVIGTVWAVNHYLPGLLPPASPGAQAILSKDSPPEEIIERAINPLWNTVWAEGVVQELDSTGEWHTTYFQVWLDRTGLGRTVESGKQPGLLDRRGDIPPQYLNVSDGQRMARFDLINSTFDPAFSNLAFSSHPLENAGAYMVLFYPYFLHSEGGTFHITNDNIIAERTTLVMEWRPAGSELPRHRFEVDIVTGALLSHVIFAEDGLTIIREVQVQKIAYETGFPPGLASAPPLDHVQFEEGPVTPPGMEDAPLELLPSPTPEPQPSPFPIAVSPYISLELVDSLPVVDASPGELYFQWVDHSSSLAHLLRIPFDCLRSQPVCPAQVVTGLTGSVASPIAWSPDGKGSIQFDTIPGRVLHLANPDTSEWQILAEGITPHTQVAVWSPDSAWAALALLAADGTTTQLVLVSPEGSDIRPIASELPAMKVPLGWADAKTLLFLQFRSPGKGLGGVVGELAPVIKKLDVTTGNIESLPEPAGWGLVSSYPAISPDGTILAIALGEPSELKLYDLVNQVTTTTGVNLSQPIWSPNGQWIAGVWTENGLVVLAAYNPTSGELRRLFEWPSVPVYTWSVDGEYLAIEASPNLTDIYTRQYLVSVMDGMLREFKISGDPGDYELRFPAFRP